MQKSHPKGLWYLIALYMWEYFSYYGMRAILVLYLTQHMLLSDNGAYAIYGSYTALVYLTPLFGGLIADKLFGFKNAVMMGALLMVCGHLLLGLGGDNALFYAMAFIICGYGFFKSNMSCVLGNLYSEHDTKRDAGFVLLYLGGNIGGLVAPIAVGFVAHYYGWHAGFSLAGIGMLVGFVIFMMGSKHIPKVEGQEFLIKNSSVRNLVVSALVAAIIIFSYLMLDYMLVGYVIAIAVACTAIALFFIWMQSGAKERKSLNLVFLLMFFGIAFWAFDEQMGSSIVMFIERNVNTHMMGLTVPASVFSSINSFSILVGGAIVAWIFARMKNSTEFTEMLKFGLGLLLLMVSFVLFFLGAKMATVDGISSPIWVILGLFALGVAELFIDPLALSKITSIKSKNTGFIAAAYMLFTGSVASFLAAKLADFSSFSDGANQSLIAQATLYKNLFWNISIVALVIACLWLAITFLIKKKSDLAEA